MLQVCLDQLAKRYYSYVYICKTYDIEVHESCKYDHGAHNAFVSGWLLLATSTIHFI